MPLDENPSSRANESRGESFDFNPDGNTRPARVTDFSTGHGEFSVFQGFNKWQVPLTQIEQ